MRKLRFTALMLAASAGVQGFSGCAKNKEISMPLYAETAVQTPTSSPAGGAELSGDNYNSDEYYTKIQEKVSSAAVDSDPLDLGLVGNELITPDEGAEDAELGSYKMSSSGVKLYYDDTEFSDELMLTLEKYFLSFPAADYNSYQKCMFPSYIDEMEGFLGKEYDYDLKTSFSKRCSSLADNMYGDYKITRIKLEAAPVYDETKDNLETYFESLNEVFGKDYYEQVKSESDEVIDACFYIMGEDAYGQENPIVTGYEIVFAVKDGKYYTFG